MYITYMILLKIWKSLQYLLHYVDFAAWIFYSINLFFPCKASKEIKLNDGNRVQTTSRHCENEFGFTLFSKCAHLTFKLHSVSIANLFKHNFSHVNSFPSFLKGPEKWYGTVPRATVNALLTHIATLGTIRLTIKWDWPAVFSAISYWTKKTIRATASLLWCALRPFLMRPNARRGKSAMTKIVNQDRRRTWKIMSKGKNMIRRESLELLILFWDSVLESKKFHFMSTLCQFLLI